MRPDDTVLGLKRNRRNRGPNIKDQAAEVRLYGRRAAVCLALVLLAFGALAARLTFLQVVNHAHFTTLSQNNRVKLQPLPPTRGLIFDRNGVLLADNLSSFRLEITREQVRDLDATLARLRELVEISDADITRFRRLVRRTPMYAGVALRFRLTDEEAARIAVHLHELPGVDIRTDLTRHYPLGALTAHVVGYVGRIDENELQTIDTAQYAGSSHIGKIGVERAYEDLLRGQVGHQQVEVNAQGRVVRVLQSTPPVPGRNIYLSIDARVQQAAETALAEYTGAVVALDPTNGEVLAMVSTPSYDPNPFVNGIDSASYDALNTSPERPLFNRALRGTYPPGSTIKAIVALAGTELGVVGRNHRVYCPGHFSLPGHQHRFRDWKRGGHGTVDAVRAIAESCDVYFYDLAANLGIERMGGFLGAFGLGEATDIDLVGEKAGLVPSPEWKRRVHKLPWYPGETVIAGIGQGYVLTTPLQLAHATATLATRGARYKPRLLQRTEDPATLAVTPEPPRALDPVPVRDPQNWDQAITGMISVVHGERGTGRAIGADAPYRMGGKTGTAQVFSLRQDEKYDAKRIARHLQDHALFVAFAPAEAPRIAIAVIAENGGGGGAVAAPIARQVMDAYLLGSP